jgi:hypothetical protein
MSLIVVVDGARIVYLFKHSVSIPIGMVIEEVTEVSFKWWVLSAHLLLR